MSYRTRALEALKRLAGFRFPERITVPNDRKPTKKFRPGPSRGHRAYAAWRLPKLRARV